MEISADRRKSSGGRGVVDEVGSRDDGGIVPPEAKGPLPLALLLTVLLTVVS